MSELTNNDVTTNAPNQKTKTLAPACGPAEYAIHAASGTMQQPSK
jgi:hypothetical protein